MSIIVQSLVFDRTALSLGDLTITSDPFGTTYHIPEEGLEWPRFGNRKTFAPDAAFLPGRTLLGKVRDMGSIPLTIYAKGSSTSALRTAMVAFDAAVDQWAYDLDVTIDGQTLNLDAECVDDLPAWGVVDSGMAAAFMARCTVTIPLYPS